MESERFVSNDLEEIDSDKLSSAGIMVKSADDLLEKLENNPSKIRICVHRCEKKNRQCKFNSIKGSDYCVEHLAFNTQQDNSDKRVICPLDPKHSVYEKNFAKHLKKCNSRIKTLGEFDVKGINLYDSDLDANNNETTYEKKSNLNQSLSTYKELDDSQLKSIVDFIVELDAKLNLYNLDFNKMENEYLNQVLAVKSDEHKKTFKANIIHCDTS